jgi:hypothetical protein
MERLYTSSTNLARVVLTVAFALVVWRAAMLPVTAPEAVAWNRLIRPGAGTLLVTPGDWSGLLYGLIAKRAAGVFRLSEFSLRFPGVLGCLLYCYAVYCLCRSRIWLLAALTIPVILLNWFTIAGGTGLSIGLTAVALAHPIAGGPLLGLALAACPQIGFVPATAAAGLLYTLGFWRGIERIVIPAFAIGFVLLILPLSHGGTPLPTPGGPTDRDAAVRAAVAILRTEAGKGTTPIAASASAAPLLEFYKARYRQRNWLMGDPQPQYFLWIAPESPPSATPRQILFQKDGVVLAR